MKRLINHMPNKFNIKIIYTYRGNEIQLYYCLNNIIYLKQKNIFFKADKYVSFTLLYRQLCKSYKKELFYIYKNWRDYGKYTNEIYSLLNIEYRLLNLEYLYAVKTELYYL